MDDTTLQTLVENISLKYFKKPFVHKAIFNGRLITTGGRYLLKTHNIEINKRYYELFGENELIGIIKHELCHYHLHIEGKGYRHRDLDFRKLLQEVDAPRFCSSLPAGEKKSSNKKPILYQCSSCNQVFRRKRKINTSRYVCGKCKGKLILKNELTL